MLAQLIMDLINCYRPNLEDVKIKTASKVFTVTWGLKRTTFLTFIIFLGTDLWTFICVLSFRSIWKFFKKV